MLKRILKTLAALGAGHGVQTLTQALLPPVFISSFGVQGYGEWLALSAAVGYLGTLDFGLQTYVLNRLTALYHKGELKEFHRVQSVGLWLALGFVGIGSLIASLAFVLPLSRWLRIPSPPSRVSWTAFWLGLQILASIPLGQVLGIYRAFGQAYRGVMWGNSHRVLLLVATLTLAYLRAPFSLIAFAQFLTVAGVLVTCAGWLWRSQPELHPRLDYWRGAMAWEILKPSAFFGFFVLNNFVVYQAPVLLLQRFLGAQPVVVFSVARTLFSFARQGAALLQQAIAPEITRLDGLGDRDKLVRVYVLFESLLCSGVLIVNAGLLLLSPTLLTLWLKHPQLFDLWVFVMVMLVSILASVKEYKLYFQYMTNKHAKSGLMTFLSYSAMVLASVPAIQWFGVVGFVSVWLAAETFQIFMVHSYNSRLFAAHKEISLHPTARLAASLAVVVGLAVLMNSFLHSTRLLWQTLAALSVMGLLAMASYFLFDLQAILREGRGRLLALRLG
jgi:O-antigen/teichoic acid export membrane protein